MASLGVLKCVPRQGSKSVLSQAKDPEIRRIFFFYAHICVKNGPKKKKDLKIILCLFLQWKNCTTKLRVCV